MEIQTSTSLQVNLKLSEEEAREILVDPHGFQSELRKALAKNGSVESPLHEAKRAQQEFRKSHLPRMWEKMRANGTWTSHAIAQRCCRCGVIFDDETPRAGESSICTWCDEELTSRKIEIWDGVSE